MKLMVFKRMFPNFRFFAENKNKILQKNGGALQPRVSGRLSKSRGCSIGDGGRVATESEMTAGYFLHFFFSIAHRGDHEKFTLRRAIESVFDPDLSLLVHMNHKNLVFRLLCTSDYGIH